MSSKDRVDFNNDEYYMRYEELCERGVFFLKNRPWPMHVIKLIRRSSSRPRTRMRESQCRSTGKTNGTDKSVLRTWKAESATLVYTAVINTGRLKNPAK